ncbi:MAG: hypothetical protein PWP16_1607 [Eubacteriaceae bacterium]|jgi:hypothetical protein|nr:hypothetical protein [Eubacteriaceae bacterium]MDK2905433.1 hypothetical protein [Eubacteriaceae bacterium]MDK2935273.1 hypothetical protein [Eubacteriaceae bacterium]MDK2962389.1 hypothetical protein [Eubacteriaceae bacterium]MDN5308244.1 hypothetical protein [Eubacteriaceae bacterium]
MYQDIFLPIVFELSLSSDQRCLTSEWKKLIHELLQVYLKQFCNDDLYIIGHVKALAVLGKQDYIKFSCSNNSGNIDIQDHGCQEGISEVDVTINSLVANICESESRQMMEKACQALKNSKEISNLKIDIKKNSKPKQKHHHFHNSKVSDCPICNSHNH